MRGRWPAIAAALALAMAVVGHTVLPASETAPPPIAGVAPDYGPQRVSVVPNATAIVRRIWLPGLDVGYDPQGLAVDARAVYVSFYRSNRLAVHRGPCRVIRIDPASGRPTGSLDIPSPCGHAGGLALGGDGQLYVADTHTLFAIPLARAFAPGGAPIRRFALGAGLAGGLAASSANGIWLGTYREHGPGRLYRFAAATLAALHNGDTLQASQAATVLPIPDFAQGAAFDGGALWVARSDWNWGTLDRLDPATGAVQQRFRIAPGVEGIAFDGSGRLWAVSEAGARHFYDHPVFRLVEPFFPLVFALDPARLQ
jgi:sugar lactone lactonase YvrE